MDDHTNLDWGLAGGFLQLLYSGRVGPPGHPFVPTCTAENVAGSERVPKGSPLNIRGRIAMRPARSSRCGLWGLLVFAGLLAGFPQHVKGRLVFMPQDSVNI